MIARIQEDLSLHDFEINVRTLVSDVENAYWALYFAYRNLEATRIGANSALATWKSIYALFESGAQGGEAENEAQAREQYFFFQSRLQDALNRVYATEQQLRYLLGLTPNDGRIIRPADEPTTAKVAFDWNEILAEALARRPELRRQKWVIKQRELELIAVRNQLLPQLDLVALYRFLGLGDTLYGQNPPGAIFPDQDTSAWDELLGGDYQEGRLGLQFVMPLGYRRELAQVRNRQLQLARDKAVLEEMELEITHQLTSALQDLESNYVQSQSNFDRILAATREVEAMQASYDAGVGTLDRLLDAQRRRSDADVAFYQALADYNLAIIQVHLRKGSLLEYDGIVLAEGPWPAKAYYDAHAVARRRDASYYLDYGYSRPKVVSRGPVPQNVADGLGMEAVAVPNQEAEDVQLEPIPAPEPGTDQPPLPSADPASDLMPPAPQSAGPALSRPQLQAETRPRTPQVQVAAHSESLVDPNPVSSGSRPQVESPADQRSAAATSPAVQLKWKAMK